MTTHIKLTPRFEQLLHCLQQGMSNKAIAAHLGISEHTVSAHLWRLYQRVGVKSRTGALHWMHQNKPDQNLAATAAALNAANELAAMINAVALPPLVRRQLGEFLALSNAALALENTAEPACA